VAAHLRREGVEVETAPAPYGKFTVSVDDETVVDGGAWAFLGILPSVRTIRERVMESVRRKRGDISEGSTDA